MKIPNELQDLLNNPQQLIELLSTVKQLVQENAELKEKIARLESANRKLTKLAFGPRTEKRPIPSGEDPQGFLFGEARDALQAKVEAQLESAQTVEEYKRKKARRRSKFPDNLPREKTICELPEDHRHCACGSELQEMGTAEVTEILERVEYSCIHEIHRKKYCCRNCQSGVTVAPGPTRVIEKGLLGNSFAAHLLVERFQFHMPYHRQETKYRSEGIKISRSVLCETAARCAKLLTPVFECLKKEILSRDYLKADETTSVLQKSTEGGRRTAYFWAYLAPKFGVVFDFTESRSRDGPTNMLADFSGYLQIDGYPGYNEITGPERVTRVGCWVHVRRKFSEAMRSDPEFAAEGIRLIDQLFVLDRPTRLLSSEERHARRTKEIAPLLPEFKEWLDLRQTQVLKGSEVGNAISYALNQWATLTIFLEHGQIDLDNNTVEHMMRHIAVGRKNWTNIGSPEGGHRAAIFYSLIQTCSLLGVNPRKYLLDVLVRAKEGEDPAVLTPSRWMAAQEQIATVASAV